MRFAVLRAGSIFRLFSVSATLAVIRGSVWPMKSESNPEFEKFTKVMDGLMAVSYQELQGKLKEHKRQKAKKKRAKQGASRASKDSS